MHVQSEYHNDFETTKLHPQHGGRVNGFGASNNYRASFSAFPNRTQINPSVIGATSLRDTNTFYPTQADVFPAQVSSPIQQHLPQYETHSGSDFGGHKPYMENFNQTSSMLPHHGRHSISHFPQQNHHKFNPNHQFGNPVQLASQTPYGPHLPVGAMNGAHQPQAPTGPPSREVNNSNATSASSQEEISTIFVVGFPEDMQEREFQNMFTFSAGFEAATLKIPNKEYTAYGANGIRGYQGYTGSNDPYNLVTVNQGGVVVDGGRDGTMSSWPAVPGDEGNHFVGTSLAPRKQIIGFAKFKSREHALEAREVLQGRRVDLDKGSILKAEMAKKNLHTKRGVGPLPGGPAGPNMNPSSAMQNASHGPAPNHSLEPFPLQNESFPPRERDLPLGGIDLGRLGTWRDQIQRDVHAITNGIGSASTTEFHPRKDREEEEHRRRERDANLYNAMGISHGVTRGPREREEEERERRRKDKEARLRASNSTAFDAFHSVPAGNAPPLSRQNSGLNGIINGNALLPPHNEGTPSLGSSPLLQNAFASNQYEDMPGPWDKLHQTVPNGTSLPQSSSLRSTSPLDNEEIDPRFSPQENQATDSLSGQHRAPSESSVSSAISPHHGIIGGGSSIGSGASDADLNKAMNDLVLNTDNGTTSPQLPSPASGASSNSTKNAVDQNPPINTLYVGNLPAPSPSIGFSNEQLEESIRQLFMSQPGYRRLCFRQKNNGPMCFVEFEDVSHATKALNELYGHTLGGLVKGGGIRLSYSKNPLGVRTPTSATGQSIGFQQQQAMQSLNSFQPEQFLPRSGDDLVPQSHLSRRDTIGSFGGNFLTSPPPRFTSPPINNFGPTSLNTGPSFNLRTNGGSLSSLYSYSLAAAGGVGHSNSSAQFSPFGITNTPTIPEQTSSSDDPALHSHHHFAHRTLSPPVNVEASRAG
ncbi:hypothetical protein FA15DRAFT_589433 [Coprinopsis marcescibilis]|uniref:RRM domain-containing protein n=1 Tax=Coprinopsis marcescibilis TaxID=230819 RepID=A0A5C3L074_COPMA|nr:hypothetical protein FA15DRAFT_589433 [Coprinopsis marcescibilis]